MSNSSTIGYIINEVTAQDIEFNIINQHRDFVIAEGILQEAEKENRNKRCYSAEDLRREIMAPRQQELIKSGNMKGEAGHPMDINLNRQQTIDPKYVQVWFTKMWMDGNFVKAQFRGCNNSYGEEFNLDLLDGQKPSFSLRALGRIENVRGKAYVRGLKMITYDRVYFPSHDAAYTQKIISDSDSLKKGSRGKKDNALVSESFLAQPYRTTTPPGNKMVITESTIVPIMNEQVRNYIITESYNMKVINDNFDTLVQSIQLHEDGKYVSIVDYDHNTIVIPLENYIQRDLMTFCSNL